MLYTMSVMMVYAIQYYLLKYQAQIFYWIRLV